jgi:hypothetical protein
MRTSVRIILNSPFEDIDIEVDIEIEIDAEGYDVVRVYADEAFDDMIAAGDAAEILPGLWGYPHSIGEFDSISEVPVKGRRDIVDMIDGLANDAEIDWESISSSYEDDRAEDYDDTENR